MKFTSSSMRVQEADCPCESGIEVIPSHSKSGQTAAFCPQPQPCFEEAVLDGSSVELMHLGVPETAYGCIFADDAFVSCIILESKVQSLVRKHPPGKSWNLVEQRLEFCEDWKHRGNAPNAPNASHQKMHRVRFSVPKKSRLKTLSPYPHNLNGKMDSEQDGGDNPNVLSKGLTRLEKKLDALETFNGKMNRLEEVLLEVQQSISSQSILLQELQGSKRSGAAVVAGSPEGPTFPEASGTASAPLSSRSILRKQVRTVEAAELIPVPSDLPMTLAILPGEVKAEPSKGHLDESKWRCLILMSLT